MIKRSLHLYLILYPVVERLIYFVDYKPDYENNKLLTAALVLVSRPNLFYKQVGVQNPLKQMNNFKPSINRPIFS